MDVSQRTLDVLPAFADRENRELDASVQALMASLKLTSADVAAQRARGAAMVDHLRHVQLELAGSQLRRDARVKELATEDHMRRLNAGEAARLDRAARDREAEREALRGRAAALAADATRQEARLQQFRVVMNWNRDELAQWALAHAQREDDALALEAYRRRDESRAKQLTAQLERSSAALAAAKQALADETTEARAAQARLQGAEEAGRAAHRERQAVAAQWDDALAALERRDAAIQAASKAIAARAGPVEAERASMLAQAQALAADEQQGGRLAKQVVVSERRLAALRQAYAAGQTALAAAADRVEIVSNTLGQCREDGAAAAAANQLTREAIEKKRKRLDDAEASRACARARLADGGAQRSSLEARVAELLRMQQEEEARIAAADADARALLAEATTAEQRLAAARRGVRDATVELGGAKAQGRALRTQITRLADQELRQQEITYNVDYQLVMMERRLARAGGQRTDDETAALTARIGELTAALTAAAAEHRLLAAAVKTVAVHLSARHLQAQAQAQREQAETRKQETALRGRAAAMQLESAAVSRALRAATAAKEDGLVAADVAALELRRLRGALDAAAREVAALQQRKAELQDTVLTQQRTLQAQAEALQAELRGARANLHHGTLELQERRAAAGRLAAKHAVLAARVRPSDEAQDAEPRSQAYYLIQAAQQREELVVEADALRETIAAAERDEAALTAAAGQLLDGNERLDDSFRNSDGGALEERQAELQATREKAAAALEAARGRFVDQTAVAETCAGKLAARRAEEERLTAALDSQSQRKAEADNKLARQKERQARAWERLQRVKSTARARLGEDFAAADAAVRAKTAKKQASASSERRTIAAQQRTAFSSAEGLPAERPVSAASTVDSIASKVSTKSWRMQQPDSTTELGLVLSGGIAVAQTLSAAHAGARPGSGSRQRSRPSSVNSIASSRRSTGPVRSATHVQTFQLVLDVA